jgi:hypothetical protein
MRSARQTRFIETIAQAARVNRSPASPRACRHHLSSRTGETQISSPSIHGREGI